MTIRANVPILTSLDPNYEEKLIQKVTDLYLKWRRHHNTA